MKMFDVIVATAAGPVLDYLVERAVASGEYSEEETLQAARAGTLRYSTDWGRGGPLIERYGVWLFGPHEKRSYWIAAANKGRLKPVNAMATEPLTAVMRSIVLATLGERAKVPAELLEGRA